MRGDHDVIQTELSIEKALEFAGDNSTYQKRRLLILCVIILSLAILTAKIPLQGTALTMLFLVASGAGQIVCPIYMSLRTCTLGLAGFAFFGAAFYPVNSLLKDFAYLGLGFFGRGFYVSSLIYLNEIGGDRFRAWSLLVVFGIWGISSLFSSLERTMKLPAWIFNYFFIFLPIIVDSYFILQMWKPSPFRLFTKRLFDEAKQVLNDMAEENGRAYIPYGLQGEKDDEYLQYKKPTYTDIIFRPIIRKITVPLLALWIYREYIYFGSYMIIPELGEEITKNYFLISISEILGVLLSYPIRLNFKRINAFFGLVSFISVFSFFSSFTTLDSTCMQFGETCPTKYIYRISIMVIRFAIVVMGNLLISYTLEIYPSNARSLGFSLCLGISSVGSIVMPWINESFMYADLSGFISFAVASFTAMYFVLKLNETYGRMRSQTLEQLEQNAPEISLKSWATLNF